MDTVNEDEALSEYSESGRSSNGSCLLTEDEDEEYNEEEEDLSDADSCIEVSDSDEEISDFKSAFKEVQLSYGLHSISIDINSVVFLVELKK